MVLNELSGYRHIVRFFFRFFFREKELHYEYHNFINVQGWRGRVDKGDVLPDYTK